MDFRNYRADIPSSIHEDRLMVDSHLHHMNREIIISV